ncbi:MAG: hypothetical protein HQK89_12850, partial [Nitrospirae bacterium]|nr:hypothetical protein [Nitrospirota bacterium]
MPNLIKSIVINAPLEKVFDFLNKPENLKEIYPRIVEILDITPLANSCHTYRWKFSMVAGIQREVVSENTEIIPNKKISTKNTCGLKGWKFVFIDETMEFDTINGKTKIVYKA